MPLNAAEVILARSMEPAIRMRPAIHFNGKVISYTEFHAMVNRAANTFLGMGVARGERVPLLLNDSPLYAACILGLMKIGAVAIPLNTKLKLEEYAFIAADCGAKWLVHDPMFAGVLGEAAGVRLLPACGAKDSMLRRMNTASSHAAFAVLEEEDPCFWLYSSGTTGSPKGIIHTQRGAAQTSKLMREVLKIDEGSVVFCTSKLFFAFALDNALLGVIRAGAATVLNEAWADPETVVMQAGSIKPDAFLTVPTFFRRLLQLPEENLAVFKDIPLYATGGERVPDTVAIRWKEVTGHELLPCHGMSETFCNTFSNRPGEVRQGSCGKPLAGVEPMLLASGARPGELFAAAEPVGINEPGVLWLKHPSLAARYNSAQKTAESFADGWFCTNDLFRVDEDGYWFHEGRGDELLKIAGQWVKPHDVEDAVLAAGVREAACVVVPDADGFERLALYVVPAEAGSLEAIEEQARAALPSHSWPKWVRSLEELPRTPTGKVQKFKLKQMLRAELGFVESEPELVPEPPPVEEPALEAPEKKKRVRPRKSPAAQAVLAELPLDAAMGDAAAPEDDAIEDAASEFTPESVSEGDADIEAAVAQPEASGVIAPEGLLESGEEEAAEAAVAGAEEAGVAAEESGAAPAGESETVDQTAPPEEAGETPAPAPQEGAPDGQASPGEAAPQEPRP
jgi:benzoate-CoA ligase